VKDATEKKRRLRVSASEALEPTSEFRMKIRRMPALTVFERAVKRQLIRVVPPKESI